MGATLKVGGPVARVHVANRNEIARPGKGKEFAQPGSCGRNLNGAVGFGERRGARKRPREDSGVCERFDEFGHVVNYS